MIRLLFFLLLLNTSLLAQKKITTIKITDEILSASVDRVGEIYVITKNAHIQKFDANGKLISFYKRGPAPSLFEPRDGSRLFAFFKADRKIEYLSPSFEVQTSSVIDSAFVIDPWLACSSGDYNLWVIDAADHTLKKIDPRSSAVPVDVKFPENFPSDLSAITTMREYQGFLFFLDKRKGIHIFNGMGKWIKTISIQDPTYFNFLGEELYYPEHNKLVFINLFSAERREMLVKQPFKIALLTDERLFLVQKTAIDFFEYKP